MNILALDLGTTTGWALRVRSGVVTSGSAKCAGKPSEKPGQRWINFRNQLSELARAAGEIHVVYVEDVRRHVGVQAAHAYGAFRAQLDIWCLVNNVRLVPVGVGVIKKHWTGNGRATKDEMMAQARERGFKPGDDNQADALAILAYGLNAEGLVRQPIGRAA